MTPLVPTDRPRVAGPVTTGGSSDEELVRRFLVDVRAGRHVERAARYLAPRVLAHQGRPGAARSVVTRTPGEYADHVREMLRASGPWTFEIRSVERAGNLIEARWEQTGVVNEDGPSRGRTVVEHGHAAYRVVGALISEYWIEFHHEIEGKRGATMPEVLRYAAFSQDPGGGNPAGIVLDGTGMTAEQMLATAAEVGFSETAFLLPEADRIRARYFSPLAEVTFCGHATIAAAVARAERQGPERLVLETLAGPVQVSSGRDADGSWRATLTSVPPRTSELSDADRRAVLDALGWAESDLDPDLPPRVGYAGAWHPILAVRSRTRLAALDYDMAALTELMAARGWTTVDLVWRETATRFHARNPFPPGGVVEDPATGAAAAALGGYLREGGHVDVPSVVTVLQGADMGRPSVLTVGIPVDPTQGIDVTGHAVALGTTA